MLRPAGVRSMPLMASSPSMPADRLQSGRGHDDDIGRGHQHRLGGQLPRVDHAQFGGDVDRADGSDRRVDARARPEDQLGRRRRAGTAPALVGGRRSRCASSARAHRSARSSRRPVPRRGSGTPSASATARTLAAGPSMVRSRSMTTTGMSRSRSCSSVSTGRARSVASTTVGSKPAIGSVFNARW